MTSGQRAALRRRGLRPHARTSRIAFRVDATLKRPHINVHDKLGSHLLLLYTVDEVHADVARGRRGPVLLDRRRYYFVNVAVVVSIDLQPMFKILNFTIVEDFLAGFFPRTS